MTTETPVLLVVAGPAGAVDLFAGETFTVKLADSSGLLSATGTGISGSGSKALTISGTLAQVNAGQKPLADFVSVPGSYQTYLDLGRFRNALILEDTKRYASLTNFIALYRLEAYQPSPVAAGPVAPK